ncbi:MAG: hypothetical protein QM652_11275 [Legionella sp.]|uniref:hypothetical protein n=1 Tax=Legionella sp. TaxID=459 RepID=UPI0039E381E7
MKFEIITNRICDTLSREAFVAFKQTWLETNRQKIESEIERRLVDPNRRRRSYWEYRNNTEGQVRQEYSSLFDRTIRPYLERLWKQKIEEADFVGQLDRFFNRHPWLWPLANLHGNDSFPEEYIRPIIHNTLVHHASRYELIFHGYDTLNPSSYTISWPADNEILARRVHDYPLQLFRNNNYTPFYPLPSLNNYWKNLRPLNLYRLSRLDVYRLLFKHFNVDLFSIRQLQLDLQLVLKVMPVELDELKELDEISKRYCSSWLINLGTLDTPYWILLDKYHNKISLYISSEIAEEEFEEKLNKIRDCFPIDEIVEVDAPYQTQYTDLPDNLMWQYQLFARVLPYCIQSNRSMPLQAYRNPVSLYHLMSYVWESLIESSELISGKVEQAARGFQYASPFSEKSWSLLLTQPSFEDSKQTKSLEPLRAKEILKAVDEKKLHLTPTDPSCREYTLSTIVERNYFLQACFMACFHPTSQIILTLTAESKKDMPDIPTYIFDKVTEQLNHVRFTVSSTIQAINPGHFLPLVRLSNAAACNRLLQTAYSIPLADMTIDNRWGDAGRLIFSLFKKQTAYFEPNAIQTYLQKEKTWRKSWFNPKQVSETDSFAWQLAQFAQMGRLGLDAFFEYLRDSHLRYWHEIHQTPQLNIPVLFDLNGDRLLSAAQYIEYLREQLSDFIRDERCVPKFREIHLILPNPSTLAARKETCKLVCSVSNCRYTHYQEANVFFLYDFKTLSASEQDIWLKEFEELANQKDKPLIAMIRIPELDSQISDNVQANRLKARYRGLQNKILDNQRQCNEKKLANNTHIFYQGANGNLEPMVDIRDFKHRMKQPFEGNDETILLAANTPGIQQELQQNIEAQHEIVQQLEEKKVFYHEVKPEIKRYGLDTSRLITRVTIQNHLKPSEDVKDWAEEFSLWVGSSKDVPYLVQYIEPEALEKIRQHQSFFRMGFEPNHLPFGFYLAHHPNSQTSYIFCYDENKAKREHHEWAARAKEIRNPFLLHLANKKMAVNFDGDFRQFHLIGDDEQAQVSLWHYLATKWINLEQNELQNKWIRQVSKRYINTMHPDIPIRISRYEVSGNLDAPWILATVKENMAGWAQTVLGYGKGLDFIRLFIGSMDEPQLKAFGQLCYYYDSEKEKLGSSHFLRIAYAFYQAFGEYNFSIWQQALFAKSDNATELLEKPVLDAIGLSLISLKDKSPAYTHIWFRLLQAQAQHQSLVRYDHLWYAYQTLISYIDKKQLNLHDDVVTHFLSLQVTFESVVWLDRLYHCLKRAEGQLYELDVQQIILNNLDKIDWHSNGLSYAMTHNQMPYWSEDLVLEGFKDALPEMGYTPIWDRPIAKKSLAVQFGRYLAAALRINLKQYQFYSKHIKPLLESEFIFYPVARLLLIHLTYGVEQISNWSSADCKVILTALSGKDVQDEVVWLNQQFKLDQKSRGVFYQVSFVHVPLVCRVLKGYGLENLELCDLNKRIALLNALGKTCQYLQSQAMLESPGIILQLQKMISQAVRDERYLTAMYQTPWLLTIGNNPWRGWSFSTNRTILNGQKRLLQQLESISYQTSTWLPDFEDINRDLAQLSDDYLPFDLDNKRRKIIAAWIGNGCDIKEQDAIFRELTLKEKDNLILQSTEQFLIQHKKENTVLISMLIPHLAIKADLFRPERALAHWVKLLKRIDNKPHFNDLGVVLGCIVHHVKEQASAMISLPQLSDIIENLMLPEHDELTHFPSEILVDLLRQADKSLTSNRLNDLSDELAPSLKTKVKRIINAKIPNQIKSILVKIISRNLSEEQHIKIVRHFVHYQLNRLSIDYQMEVANALLLIDSVPPAASDALINTLFFLPEDTEVRPLWLKSRLQLLQEINKKSSLLPLQMMAPLLLEKQQKIPEIEIIGIYTLTSGAVHGVALKTVLQQLNSCDLKKLAHYCACSPRPSAEYLIKWLPTCSVDELIHHFETIEQAKDLRHYSVTKSDNRELKRVLGGIKEKGIGYITDTKQKQVIGLLCYINAYAQEYNLAHIPSDMLKETLRQTAQWLQATNDETTQLTYRLQLLAMLREILLRQAGKWTNHTQMIALIYASLHNDESIFHQIKTGQGKSIITVMRVAFHALNGKVVDVFTAKESLSSRDHEEFGSILDAIGIEHTHITPNSSENAYQVGDEVFGAVNYITPGSFSLYQSGHCWSEESKRYINYHSKQRVAFFDEGDHILLDEQTMFNFSYGGESGKLYNYDAWVYQATWCYFQTIKDTLPTNEKGIPFISRKKHLAELCNYLQQQGDFSPIQSGFIKTYLAPVVDSKVQNKTQAINERDKILASLLSAAYIANNLHENRDFCVQTATMPLANGVTIQSRVAQVVINNQVQDGATYSEHVHQFLHVRLNEIALDKGEQPNFFIAPDSSIVLSQNVPSLMRYYSQIEGCSGTMGDAGALAVYEERFGIKHVVKLPTHELSQTTYKGIIFCEGPEEYERTIAACLKEHNQMPALVITEDDLAVKALSNCQRRLLPENRVTKLICDTNDSGQSENEIVLQAGKPGVIVISSRMARGTNIQPETKEGLLVIRANPNIPRFAKQGGGRQGRNGAKGVLIDIIDYAKIQDEYQNFLTSKDSLRLAQLMERERHHLNKKFAKHQRDQSHQWDWLIQDKDKQEKYLKTRVVHYLKHEIKLQREQNIRSKEMIVSECSAHIMGILAHHIGEEQSIMRALRKDWLCCRESMESAWQQRMKGAVEDNKIVFDAFYEKAKHAWQTFAGKYSAYVDNALLDNKDSLLHSVASVNKLAWNTGDEALVAPEPTQQVDMTEVIDFYQNFISRVGPHVLSDLPKSLQELFYGKVNKGLNDLDGFYHRLISASQKREDGNRETLIHNTQALFAGLTSLPLPVVTYIPLAYMIKLVSILDVARIESDFIDKLSCLFQAFQHPWAQSVPKLTAHHMTACAKTSVFITRLICRGFITKDSAECQRFSTSQAVSNITDTLWEDYWETLTPNQFACFDRFINQDEAVIRLLTTRLSRLHWRKLLGQLGRYDITRPEDAQYLDSVRHYFRENQELLNKSHSETLTALLDVFFYYLDRRIDVKHFPIPHCFVQASIEENIQFIHFIAEQYMINEKEIGQLVEIINTAYAENQIGAKEMTEKVMPYIRALPPNLPFIMIKTRLAHIADAHNFRDFSSAIKALTEIGDALNVFTHCKGITTFENSLPQEGKFESLLKRTQDLVLRFDETNHSYEAKKILQQLSHSKYDVFDANTCLMAYEQYDNHYEDILMLLLRARKVMNTDTYELFYKACFNHQLDNKPIREELTRIVSLFEEYENLFATKTSEQYKQKAFILKQCLQKGGIDSVLIQLKILKDHRVHFNNTYVWQQWQNSGEDSQKFEEQIQFIKKTENLSREVRERICTLFEQQYDKTRLMSFVHLVEQEEKTPDAIPEQQLLHILSKWEKHEIEDGNHLKTVFDAQKLANTFATETVDNARTRQAQHIPTIEGLFGTFNQSNQGSARMHLMHSITHSLISFKAELQTKCWSFYESLMSQIGDIRKQIKQLPEEKRSLSLSQTLRSMKGLAMELSFVAKSEPTFLNKEVDVHYYSQLINAHEQGYTGSWSKYFTINRARWSQAQNLFHNLKEIASPRQQPQADFYESMLSVIAKTQKEILDKDAENKIANKKGYSRLLDITQQLGLQVCKDILADSSSNQETKQKVRDWLLVQERRVVYQLWQRLPSNHPIIPELAPYARNAANPEPAAIHRYKTAIIQLQASELPKEVRYLLPLLKGHFEVTEEMEMQAFQAKY